MNPQVEYYEYPNGIYTYKPFIVICKKHSFLFEINLTEHTKWGGCPECIRENTSFIKNLLKKIKSIINNGERQTK